MYCIDFPTISINFIRICRDFPVNSKMIKFGLSEKHTKFDNIFLMVLTNQLIYLVNVKTIRKILSIFVAFLESMDFNM